MTLDQLNFNPGQPVAPPQFFQDTSTPGNLLGALGLLSPDVASATTNADGTINEAGLTNLSGGTNTPSTPSSTFASTTASTGFDPINFAKQYPAAATTTAMQVAKEMGIDPTNPQNLATVMHSQTYLSRLSAIANGDTPTDTTPSGVQAQDGNNPIVAAPGVEPGRSITDFANDKYLQRFMSQTPTPPDSSLPIADQLSQIEAQKEQNLTNTMKARDIIYQKQQQAEDALTSLGSESKDAWVQQQIDKTNPTAAIDNRISQLQMQAVTAEARLRTMFSNLDPTEREQAVTAGLSSITDSIKNYQTIRAGVLATAKQDFTLQADERDAKIQSAKSVVDALGKTLTEVQQTNTDMNQFADLRTAYLKELKTLNKAKGSGTGSGPTTTDIENMILSKIPPGVEPTANDRTNAKAMAARVAAKLSSLPTNAGPGQISQDQALTYMQNPALPAGQTQPSWWGLRHTFNPTAANANAPAAPPQGGGPYAIPSLPISSTRVAHAAK